MNFLPLAFAIAAVLNLPERQRLIELETRLSQFPSQSVALDHGQWSMTHCEWLEMAEPTVPRHRRDAFIKECEYEKRAVSCWKLLWFARQGIAKVKEMPPGARQKRSAYIAGIRPAEEASDCLEDVLKRIECRIDALEELLGEESFRAGRVPPPAYWSFSRID
jgi:hypothetical protein